MRKLIFMVAALWVSAAAFAQTFKVEPQYPVDGGEVTITYDPVSLKGDITGVIYICNGQEWTVDDLALVQEDGLWKAQYVVPQGSVLLACKFYGEDGKWDSGPAAMGSYGMFVYAMSENDRPLRKQYTWMQRSLLFSKSLDRYAVPGWLPDQMREDDARTESVIRQELLTFPQSAPAMLYYVYTLKAKLGPVTDFSEQLQSDIDALLKNPETPEPELVRGGELARAILQDKVLYDDVQAVALKRFPNGLTARDIEMHKIFGEQDPKLSLRMLDDFMKRFPTASFAIPRTQADEIYYYRLFTTVLRRQPAMSAKSIGKYLPQMTYPDVIESYYRFVHLPYTKNIQTAKQLQPLAEVIYAELLRRENGPEDRYYAVSRNTRYSPAQWRVMMLTKGDNRDAAVTHASILAEMGENARALAIMEPVYAAAGVQNAGFNEVYARLLKLNGRDNIPFIEESVRRDAASPEMLDDLRAAYTGDDFDAYLNGLRDKEHVDALAAKLLAQMIDVPVAEPFTLMDVDGNEVSLAGLKGKVVVLDFWATWCGPCLAAMPGMKMAQDRYRDNPNVAFYFVNTLERVKEMTPDIKREIVAAIAKRGFPDFKILFDSGSFAGLGKQFPMHGIPQKAVIDPRGNVRWVVGSYEGNPLELANEVSFVVDELLAE